MANDVIQKSGLKNGYPLCFSNYLVDGFKYARTRLPNNLDKLKRLCEIWKSRRSLPSKIIIDLTKICVPAPQKRKSEKELLQDTGDEYEYNLKSMRNLIHCSNSLYNAELVSNDLKQKVQV